MILVLFLIFFVLWAVLVTTPDMSCTATGLAYSPSQINTGPLGGWLDCSGKIERWSNSLPNCRFSYHSGHFLIYCVLSLFLWAIVMLDSAVFCVSFSNKSVKRKQFIHAC